MLDLEVILENEVTSLFMSEGISSVFLEGVKVNGIVLCFLLVGMWGSKFRDLHQACWVLLLSF